MKRKAIVADCTGGEIVRLAAGTVRIVHRMSGLRRWARLLDAETLRETRDHLWLLPHTPVLEVVAEPSTRVVDGGETDPLLARQR